MSDSFFDILLRAFRKALRPDVPFAAPFQNSARDADLTFRISMLGPSSVGKTSVVAAMLRDATDALRNSGVTLEPYDLHTETRITEHLNAITGLLYARQFSPTAIKANIEKVLFRLRLATGSDDVGIRFDLLDYPGGWLDPEHRGAENQQQWEECLRFMEESTTLLIPVDAAVLMEAQLNRQKMSLPFLLAPVQIRDIAVRWAAARTRSPDEPATMVLVPVKCESYFADNGGLQDDSAELYARTVDFYGDVRDSVMAEAPHAKIFYAPVDTLGCVHLISARWTPNPMDPDLLECEPRFAIRPPGKLQPKGIDSLLYLVCRQLAEARKRADELALKARQQEADDAAVLAARREGPVKEILIRLSGERELRRQNSLFASARVRAELEKIERLNRVIDRLAGRPLSPRTRQW